AKVKPFATLLAGNASQSANAVVTKRSGPPYHPTAAPNSSGPSLRMLMSLPRDVSARFAARVLRSLLLVIVTFLALPRAGHAQGTEIVRGKVIGLDGKPIGDATVIVTGLTSQATLTAHTNDKGIFTALFQNAEGDYLVSIRKIGFAPYNTRATRTGLSSVLNI